MFVSWELLKDFIELDISPEEAASHQPRVVFLDEKNSPRAL